MIILLEDVYRVVSESGINHLNFSVDSAVGFLKVHPDVASTDVSFHRQVEVSLVNKATGSQSVQPDPSTGNVLPSLNFRFTFLSRFK